MATTLLAVGSTTASSADFTIPAGESVALTLAAAANGPVPYNAFVQVEYKTGSVYTPYLDLTGAPGEGATELRNPSTEEMTWRVTRNPAGASGGAAGVTLWQAA